MAAGRGILIIALLAVGLAVQGAPAAAQETVLCDGQVATIVGTAERDVLVGTDGPDVIAGLGGNDVIRSGGGNDIVCAGGGNDRVRGQGGSDRIFGGPGNDVLYGNAHADFIFGGSGNDVIWGGVGPDQLLAGHGVDVINAGHGNDVARGGAGNDKVYGGTGADELFGGVGDDIITGGKGLDALFGNEGNDRLSGGGGVDSLEGGWGSDRCNDPQNTFTTSHQTCEVLLMPIGYEVTGTVTQVGTGDPLTDFIVVLSDNSDPNIGEVSRTRTKADGSFSLRYVGRANERPSYIVADQCHKRVDLTPWSPTADVAFVVPPPGCVTFESLDGLNTIGNFSSLASHGPSRWRQSVPGIEELRITSTADGAAQPAFWLPPAGNDDQPLLVILHSWSAPYTQHAGIPFAMWAQENGWAVIAPDFRGKNDDANAVGSELAVQDAADAIDYAVAQAGVDADRVYVVGYSGGGMMALLLAGRHPDKVTAVSAWGPPHDLVEFYDFSRRMGRGYAGDISRACGGDPTKPGPVQDECLTRSPVTYLGSARDHAVPVFIAQGIHDPYVPPNVAAEVFNQLADPKDRLSAGDVDLFGRGRVPAHLSDWSTTLTYFGNGDPAPVFARQSGSALLVYFQAGHNMVYNATAEWFASDPH